MTGESSVKRSEDLILGTLSSIVHSERRPPGIGLPAEPDATSFTRSAQHCAGQELLANSELPKGDQSFQQRKGWPADATASSKLRLQLGVFRISKLEKILLMLSQWTCYSRDCRSRQQKTWWEWEENFLIRILQIIRQCLIDNCQAHVWHAKRCSVNSVQ